jgi:hypothetical protein
VAPPPGGGWPPPPSSPPSPCALPRYETTKAGDAVAALKASLKPIATAKRDGKWQKIDAGELVPGDMVLLAAGSAVPADCIVNHGQIEVDQSALTGESLPVTLYGGDSAKMGSNVVRGEQEGTVEVGARRCRAARLPRWLAGWRPGRLPGRLLIVWLGFPAAGPRAWPPCDLTLLSPAPASPPPPLPRSSPARTPSLARPPRCCRAWTSWATSRRSCCS